jgi:hypothetical protein
MSASVNLCAWRKYMRLFMRLAHIRSYFASAARIRTYLRLESINPAHASLEPCVESLKFVLKNTHPAQIYVPSS